MDVTEVVVRRTVHKISKKGRKVTNYTIAFNGIYCDAEMTSDQGSNSDEYYLITTVWSKLGGNKVKTQTTKVPEGRLVFADVDKGEARPLRATLYSGPAEEVVVGTQLFEEDFGDADATTGQVAKWADSAVDAAKKTTIPLLDSVVAHFGAIGNYLFHFDDDMVARYQTRQFTEQRLAQLAAAPAKKEFGIPFRFRTRHQGGGAHVVAYYDVLAR